MAISVGHSVVKDKYGKIKYRKFQKDGYDHYRIRVFLEGEDLANVSFVEYELHPTFTNPTKTIDHARDRFSLYIWTWGEFDINVTIHMIDGKKKAIVYALKYSSSLPADDAAYVDESPLTCKGD